MPSLKNVVARYLNNRGGNRRKGGGSAMPRTNPAKGPVVLVPLGQRQAPRRSPGQFRGGRRRSSARGGFTQRRVSAPIAKANIRKNRGPSMNGRGVTVIKHTEYLQEVTGSVDFAVTPIAINPGLVGSFPWLANGASQYEEYRFRRLAFKYETETSTTTTGAVILVTDYDALDVPFSNKQQAMDYRGATRTAPWTAVTHNVGGKESTPYSKRYVRAGAVPAGGDLKLILHKTR